MAGYPLPDATLASHLAVVGKTGAGKTSTTKLAVERLAGQGDRVCVLDPIKSDWWGLTSSADGKRPGLAFYILGGPHGHMPLHPGAGRALAEIVANGELPLSILDMRYFGPGDHARFFCDFAEVLLNQQRGVVHLVMEEAHLFAPKERSGIGDENRSIHWAKMLATAGRSAGIRLIAATQRTQSLHNAVLGSCETLIAHRLTTPADQKPIVDWLKGNTPKDVAAEVAASLSRLPTGTGWVCSGELGLFEKVAFPRIASFDNSATPTGAMGKVQVRTAPVDLERLRTVIGDAVAAVDAADPKLLKERIARLEAQLAAKTPASPDEDVIYDRLNEAYVAGVKHGARLGLRSGYSSGFGAALNAAQSALSPLFIAPAREPSENSVETNASLLLLRLGGYHEGAEEKGAAPALASERQTATVRGEDEPPDAAEANGVRLVTVDGVITGAQLHLLRSLAWWKAMGHDAVSRSQLAAIAGWKVKSSHLRNRLTELLGKGLVEYPSQGVVGLTAKGCAFAPKPDTAQTLIGSIRTILSGAQRTLFDAITARVGRSPSRHELAEVVSWEVTSSHLRNRLTELKNLELISYPRVNHVELQAWVREGMK